ncbi:MAG: hypothetical protein AAF358_19005 [Pseudomonadota bacterium]
MRRLLAVSLILMASGPTFAESAEREFELLPFPDGDYSDRITIGIPFPPGDLSSVADFQLFVDGKSVEIAARPILRWHWLDNSIRALRVQFDLSVGTDKKFHFLTGSAAGPPMNTLAEDTQAGMSFLAVMSPHWLTRSRVAGPQVPWSRHEPYDRFVDTGYQWARDLPLDGKGAAWLFDRTTTILRHYVRTGDPMVLRHGVRAARFYVSHIKKDGAPGRPDCRGGWQYAGISPCDPKYVYLEPLLIYSALTGDDSFLEAALIEKMVSAWGTIPGPYRTTSKMFTERFAGLGLLAITAAWEITGNKKYLDAVGSRIGWLHSHQNGNPDAQPPDGSWRHSWQKHEFERYDPVTDTRGASPWMSENIISGLWSAWWATQDPRIPQMIASFGEYLENHGWIRDDVFVVSGNTWKSDCGGKDAPISWYWSSSVEPLNKLIAIQNDHGWNSDAHSPELAFVSAAAAYFTDDAELRYRLLSRIALLEQTTFNPRCARNSRPPRRFNWSNRSTPGYRWIINELRDP